METAELNAIDRHLAVFLPRIAPKPSPELELAVQLLSHQQANGHVCLSLDRATGEILQAAGIRQPLPPKKLWTQKLRQSGVVGSPGDFKPLILDGAARLYFQRYWQYEDAVARDIAARLQNAPEIDPALLRSACAQLLSGQSPLQKLAAFTAATSNLCVISGAPGTGKTYMVVLLCALLVALWPEIKIALAAPTGKAAARLKESLADAQPTTRLPPEIVARLPKDASTIQRLLGVVGESGKFRHDAENPLNVDAVVIDEASMIDLALLAKLLTAVRPDARVILVGDKDQLASVEAGSAFRDICTPGRALSISAERAAQFEAVTGEKIADVMPRQAAIHDSIIELRENFRFSAGQGIAELSGAINRGDARAAAGVLRAGGQVAWQPTPRNLARALRERVLPAFKKITGASNPAEALDRLGDFAVLCALRRGPFGAENVNSVIERMLRDCGAIAGNSQNYHGRPVLVLHNDYNLELFNGDLGIVFESSGEPRVYFAGAGGELRSFAPARLPPHATAFALTVHKSQGSEFNEALVILPDRDAPVLTRELLYTAVTRVRRHVQIWAGENILEQTIVRRIWRSSGLREALWGEVARN